MFYKFYSQLEQIIGMQTDHKPFFLPKNHPQFLLHIQIDPIPQEKSILLCLSIVYHPEVRHTWHILFLIRFYSTSCKKFLNITVHHQLQSSAINAFSRLPEPLEVFQQQLQFPCIIRLLMQEIKFRSKLHKFHNLHEKNKK